MDVKTALCAYWVLSPLSYNMLLTSLCIVSSYIYIKKKKTTLNGIAVKVHRVCAKIWREHFKMMGWGEREKKIWHIRPFLIRKRHKSNLQVFFVYNKIRTQINFTNHRLYFSVLKTSFFCTNITNSWSLILTQYFGPGADLHKDIGVEIFNVLIRYFSN